MLYWSILLSDNAIFNTLDLCKNKPNLSLERKKRFFLSAPQSKMSFKISLMTNQQKKQRMKIVFGTWDENIEWIIWISSIKCSKAKQKIARTAKQAKTIFDWARKKNIEEKKIKAISTMLEWKPPNIRFSILSDLFSFFFFLEISFSKATWKCLKLDDKRNSFIDFHQFD